VADEAVDELLGFRTSGADVDDHVADQLVPFLALAGDESRPDVSDGVFPSAHRAWVVQQFVPAGSCWTRDRSRACASRRRADRGQSLP
jgi:RNA 3'-terminal phosphate cyclase